MISVVVPLYNEGRRARALLGHLRARRDLGEAVLVDASDRLQSQKVIAELESRLANDAGELPIRILRVQTPGRAAQMNAGAALCRGETLLFLHCDTRLPALAARRIFEGIAGKGGAAWGWFDLRLDARGAAYRILERMISLRARATGIATGDMAMFVARATFIAEGGFADIALMEDVEFSRRLKRRGRPAVIAEPALTSARRWQQNGIARTVLLMWKLRFLYWRGRSPERLAAAYRDVR